MTETERLRQALVIISGAVDDLMGGRPLEDVIGEIGKVADDALNPQENP